jgi:hypothetical protein
MEESIVENKFNYAQQVFYGSKFALQLSVSRNGIFAEMAPCVKMFEKYDWDKKQTIKLSIDEICNIIFALESLNKYGEQGYLRAAAKICGKDDKGNDRKNMQFIHVPSKGTTVRFGLNYYNGVLSFVLNKKGLDHSFVIAPQIAFRFEKFLNLMVHISFTRGL